MRKKFVYSLILLCLVGMFSSTLWAEFYVKTDLASRYIWRGFDLNPYKKPVLQPSLFYEFGDSGLSMDLWMSFSKEDKELTETNVTLAYTWKLMEQFTIETGFIHYGWYFAPDFRFEDDTSHEIYAKLGLPELVTQPAVTFFYDFTNGDGIYILIEGGHSFDLVKALEASFYTSIGYNGGQWLAEETAPGFSDFNIGLSLAFKWKDFQIVPYANYTFVLLDAIGKEDHFWFGVSLLYWLIK